MENFARALLGVTGALRLFIHCRGLVPEQMGLHLAMRTER